MSERSPNSQQLLTPSKAERAVYIDFEALAKAPRVIGLLGVAFRDGADQVVVRQFVVDEILRGAVKSRPACEGASLEEAVRIVVEQAAAVDRPIVSWSNHDRDLRRSGFDLKPLDVQQRHVRSEELHATALLTRARTSARRAINARAIPKSEVTGRARECDQRVGHVHCPWRAKSSPMRCDVNVAHSRRVALDAMNA